MNLSAQANVALCFALGLATVVAACGSEVGADGASSSGSSGPQGQFPGGGDGRGGTDPGVGDVDVASMRVEPANQVFSLTPGQSTTQPYKLFGKMKGSATEIELTTRAVFYVPDNYLMGGFPLDGSPLFTSRLPAKADDPPQRGGVATIRATIANADGPHDATTSLTLKLGLPPIVRDGAPADSATKFGGTVNAARAPKLVYPNNGTMLPPNLRRLDVHWRAAKSGNAVQTNLYEISFRSSVGEVVYYSRCMEASQKASYVDENDACGFELDEAGYNALAYTNGGQGPVTLKIRATKDNDAGTLGESAEFKVEFAQNRVDGGLYYWNVTAENIVRFDFGAAGKPEVFTDSDTCVGCHALSRDGTKMVASLDGQSNGRLVYSNDISKITYTNKAAGVVNTSSFTQWDQRTNRIQFASFNPDGSQFVAVYGDTSAKIGPSTISPPNESPPGNLSGAERNKLFFHDGTTGLRSGTFLELPFRPNHPDWSPDGNTIAMTKVNGGGTTQQTTSGNIVAVTKGGAGWSAARELVPVAANKNRFNPNFVPDSSFLYFTESDCAGQVNGDNSGNSCDGDGDAQASTWAVKTTGGAPVLLKNANTPGVVDGALTELGDTFPRSAPFQTVHRSGKLFWFTVATRRKAGLRTQSGRQHLWMFAVDPAKVLAGEDGSFTGFYLPFQDLRTSNHIGQWTEKIVGGQQPPAPAPPAAPPPPAPPGPR